MSRSFKTKHKIEVTYRNAKGYMKTETVEIMASRNNTPVQMLEAFAVNHVPLYKELYNRTVMEFKYTGISK